MYSMFASVSENVLPQHLHLLPNSFWNT